MQELKRWDIINHLIKKNGYKSYLEIGYYKGWSFDRVECNEKTAVDPNPSKVEIQQSMPYGTIFMNHVVKMTSDEFFTFIHQDQKYDIIFVDGLHESSQVDRDIQNALKHLNPGGTIVMHDCNPSSYEMTTTGTKDGEWTGDVYRSAAKVGFLFGTHFYTVDTDYGVGVLKPNLDWELPSKEKWDSTWINPDWELWNGKDGQKTKVLLHLISPEEFLEKEK